MFFCVEERKKDAPFSMAMPHSHEHWELYFLLEGQRRVFIENRMFVIEKGAFAVLPPFKMHKTEGGSYHRININISENLLSQDERQFLAECSEKGVISIKGEHFNTINALLLELVDIQNHKLRSRTENELNLTRSLIYFLSRQHCAPLSPASETKYMAGDDSLVLKIAYYLNSNYTHPIELEQLEREFFLSKATLCKHFKDGMNCTIMEYLTLIRLNRAKSLLISTEKSIEEISAECGFSSANYFGLVFKKQIGVSPLGFRKRVK